jgi:hypothetical protein
VSELIGWTIDPFPSAAQANMFTFSPGFARTTVINASHGHRHAFAPRSHAAGPALVGAQVGSLRG